jgi:hypothetical protein
VRAACRFHNTDRDLSQGSRPIFQLDREERFFDCNPRSISLF